MAALDDMAAEHGERDVFLGHGADDQYLAFGQYFGPGTVTVPNNVADELEKAVRRVNAGRDEADRVDPGKTTPKPVSLAEASDEELAAALEARQAAKEGAANVASKAAAAKAAEQKTPPPAPPAGPPPAP